MTPIALVRLLQLSSQALPIGGYSHSQGLESAIEQRVVTDEGSLSGWIGDVLEFSMKSFEIPSMLSMAAAWARNDPAAIAALNEEFLSARESAEIRAAAVQMGFSLCSLVCNLPDFPMGVVETLRSIRDPSLPCVWSATVTAWEIEPRESIMGYLWTWAENQVLVAMKAVPIGQSAGQRVLLAMGVRIAELASGVRVGKTGMDGIGENSGDDCPEGDDYSASDDYSNFTPGLAILSSQHETQYSRLFRS
jgi:urease accessory protein